ncbi:MAG: organic solvent resistance ABC transporter permease [Bdellovibrio sp. ArHS]|uniref:MlaE family ABC transporter permease n=1 Tax=Bdellovibrio sp. ArHS TaxID=1569284 RepID=UPI000582AF44|nr:ABC transporter permease [Bdellovibrio sp. ArHS]KHD88020.1 MAG: organic solvent resistance ABC transporter permease [Bdellovibrio sp. ArHS]
MIALIAETMTGIFSPPFRRKEFFQQLYFVANKSLLIILFCVSFAAIVTILESSFHMKLVIQNDSMVPGFAALLILRELGAILTALLLTSRVGAGYASEVGTMQITEQVDAFKMLGIDPVNYLVVPRFLACVLGCMMLTIIANMTCIFSAMLVSQNYLGYTPSMFLTSMDRFVQFQDMVFAAIKGACFGGVIPIVACYFGFRCQQGAEGVGRATTNTVVVASIAIIVIDFILSYTFSYLY